MENNYTKKINQAVEKGYHLDFGTVIEKSFENYKKIALIGGLTFIIIAIAAFALFFSIFAIAFGIGDITEKLTSFNPMDYSVVEIFIYFLLMVLFAGLTAPIGAGFLKMAHLAEIDKPFSVGTAFDYYKTKHFKELFISASLLGIINFAVVTGFEILELAIIGNIISYIIAFFTLLTVPLIIFANQKALDAISSSIKLVIKQPIILLGLAIVSIFFLLLGFIAFCIGIFFTIPFWSSFNYTAYNSIIPIENTSEIEDIGKIEE